MGKTLKDGAEYFDGEQVDLYEARFAGAFFLDAPNGAAMSNNDLVTFMVTARVDTPKFSHIKKTGDLKRSNSMKVEKVVPLDAEKAAWMYDQLSLKVPGVNDGIIEVVPVESTEYEEPLLIQDGFFTQQQDGLFKEEVQVV
jgi:hypothetical protein